MNLPTTPTVDALTTRSLSLALDAAALRQQAIATNIANHATRGYQPVKLDFAALMQDARHAIETRGFVDAASLQDVKPRLAPVLDARGEPAKVELDAQMADMAQNAVHFQALARALGKHLAIHALAASDGKR